MDIETKNSNRRQNLFRPFAIYIVDLLLDVHHLGKYIEQGNSDAAARLASQLASKRVRLHANSSKNTRNDLEFTYVYEKSFFFFKFFFLINRIQVQLDGNEYGIDQHGATIPLNVFPTTTVRELRAAVCQIFRFHI